MAGWEIALLILVGVVVLVVAVWGFVMITVYRTARRQMNRMSRDFDRMGEG